MMPTDPEPSDSRLDQLLAGLVAVRSGDFSRRLAGEDADPLLNEIASVFNGMNDQLALFTAEITRVAREVGTEGKLGGQANLPGALGTWRDLTDSVNAMAGNLTGQVRNISQVATAVASGDLRQRIRVDARGEILELKDTINTMVEQLSAVANEVTSLARQVGTQGNLGGQATVPGASGTWKELTDHVNVMASNLTAQVRSISHVATAVARGDLSQKINVEAKGEVAVLADVLNGMVDTLSAFAGEVTRVAHEVGTEGILGGQAHVPNVAGTWKDLTDNVNGMATNLTSQVRNIAQVTTSVAQGDLSRKIDVDARGEILELKTTINTMVDQLSAIAAEVTRVAREVGSQGRLGGQAEVEGVSGTWKRLTENVNELAGNLTRQVRAIAEVASAVATGDLTRSITVDAQGEVAELKGNINSMVQSLRRSTEANQEQEWLQSNLARIASMLQGHRDLGTLAELIMDELVPLVGAQHGTFFLADSADGEAHLRLIAGYGLRSEIEAPSQVRLGQSLIGQVARTRKPVVIPKLPDGYIRISSGLGEAPPVSLIVLPIVADDQLLGVIEAASFSPFSEVQREFLEQLMETIGATVNTILVNARTDELLAESQRLAAELQSRQDDLQRTNAELEDKAAQLARQNHDIELKNTEIEQARQEIEERASQLDLASRYKSQFLANMSHELRTPLNSLLVLARLLAQNANGNLSPKQVEYATVIHSSGSDLLQLINDILDLSKVEAGKTEVHPEWFALVSLVDDLDAVFLPLTAEKGLDFATTASPDVPAMLYTDQQRLRQILHNLVSNAVKFTDAGSVTVRIGVAGRQPGHGRITLEFSVTDTGIGIAAENLSRIFGAFAQDEAARSNYGGTGLGLAICREVATALGGRITVKSTPGQGSTFSLYLPITDTEDSSETAASDQAVPGLRADGAVSVAKQGPQVPPIAGDGPHELLRGKRVLVIDDDPRNVFALSSVLELYGLSVLHAGDGRQGIEILRDGGIDLVLLDVMMPNLDGYATAAAIRSLPESAGLPIIAVTARAMQEDKEKSIAAGASDYITKPVDTEILLAHMERWLGAPDGA